MKDFSKFPVVLMIAAVLAACGKENGVTGTSGSAPGGVPVVNGGGAPVSGVYGTWGGFPEIRVESIRMNLSLTIRAGEVAVTNRCDYGSGQSLTATVTARAEVTADRIRVLETNEHTVRDGGKTCRANVDPGEMSYELRGNELTLRRGNEAHTLRRR